MSSPKPGLVAILPCNDLDVSEAFYRRLGFAREDPASAGSEPDTYRMLAHPGGGQLHLTDAVAGWLIPGRNPFGLYLYTKDVDRLAADFKDTLLGPGAPEHKPWGMYEFALSDPDETLVRIGWPSRLIR